MCRCDMHGRAGYHCRKCCLTFRSVGGFDNHIVQGEHVDPRTRGMEPNAAGVWRRPDTTGRFA